jgi:hypothetical protein
MSRKKHSHHHPEPTRFETPALNPETKRGIIVIFLFAAAALLLLSFFQLAGTVGLFLDGQMARFFGFDRALVPILLAVIGFSLLFPERSRLGVWNYIGIILFFFSANGLFNLIWNKDMETVAEKLSACGGLIGYALSALLFRATGFWAALLILAAILLVAIILILNTSLRSIIGF